MSENTGVTRITDYKNNSKNIENLRTRRHEVTVELRKNKREDQMQKRRNIDEDGLTSPLQDVNGQSPVQLNFNEILSGMHSSNDTIIFCAVQSARKMLSRERNPPIDSMIELGIVPICVKFLEDFNKPLLQFEAAWALTNIASGTPAQTNIVIDSGAVPHFVALLGSPNPNVAEQAVWALGNISGDGPKARDLVLSHNVIPALLKLIQEDLSISFMRNIVWLMSNLCRNKNPGPPFDKIQPLLPVLTQLLHHSDLAVLTDTCWALSYVTDDDTNKLQAVVDCGAVPLLIHLLNTLEDPTILTPALRSIGNVVTGNDFQTDTVIRAGGLPCLGRLLENKKQSIVKEAAWSISNITAGNQEQIQQVIDEGIFTSIIHVLEKGDQKAQKEAAWVVANATTGGSTQQIIHLIEKYALLKPFCDLLASKDARTVRVVLNGLSNIFQIVDKMGGAENLCVVIEEIGGLDKLEQLQQHDNEEIYKKAFELIDSYFSEEDQEPLKIGDGETLVAQNVPAGGFNF